MCDISLTSGEARYKGQPCGQSAMSVCLAIVKSRIPGHGGAFLFGHIPCMLAHGVVGIGRC